VLRRTAGRHKTEPILYMPGPEDLDRQVFAEKGVPHQNLIAIDHSRVNADSIRRRGHPSLYADIHSVIEEWPESRPCCAVLLDYCGGLGIPTLRAMQAMLYRAPFRRAVVMVNMKRGRDAPTNSLRALWAGVTDDDKHRGMTLFLTVLGMMAAVGEPSDEQIVSRRKLLWHQMDPWRWDYRSGHQRFDSVMWSTAPAWSNTLDALLPKESGPASSPKQAALRRRIAAMLAWRTMRQRERRIA
jgi:hypothetical protein